MGILQKLLTSWNSFKAMQKHFESVPRSGHISWFYARLFRISRERFSLANNVNVNFVSTINDNRCIHNVKVEYFVTFRSFQFVVSHKKKWQAREMVPKTFQLHYNAELFAKKCIPIVRDVGQMAAS